jgi:hypothetical protein
MIIPQVTLERICLLVNISYAHVEYSTSTQNTVVAFHPGIF